MPLLRLIRDQLLTAKPYLSSSFSLRVRLNNLGRFRIQPFSTTSPNGKDAGKNVPFEEGTTNMTISQELASRLEKELRYKISKREEADPSFQKFLENSGFELYQRDGGSTVNLRKWIGNGECIVIRFSIRDLQSDVFNGKFKTRLFSAEDEHPIRCQIIIHKPRKGMLLFESAIIDTLFSFFNITYYPKSSKLNPIDLHDSDLTCKAFVFAYAILEEHVKEAFEIHIENRGVDHTLSHFIRAYAKFKDQTERMIWLANLRKFMLA